MSKAIQATLNRAEAETLRSTASGIDVAFPPDPLAARFMRDDAAELEARAADALALDTPPPVGAGVVGEIPICGQFDDRVAGKDSAFGCNGLAGALFLRHLPKGRQTRTPAHTVLYI